MSSVAFIFPGQGSQAAGMGLGLYQACSAAREVIDAAHDALAGEVDLRRLLFEGTREELCLTANTQPAVLSVSLAAHAAFTKRAPKLRPAFVAGHSLGEYTALVASGAMTLRDAVRVVRRRGVLMQEAVPPGAGCMAAVLGLSPDMVREACRRACLENGEVVAAANLNSRAQTVISGHESAVERAGAIAKELGARRTRRLPVSAPFHCPLMEPVKEALAEVLGAVEISRPSPPLISNVEAAPADEPEKLARLLIEQVTSPVRWLEIVESLSAAGVKTVVELGPGKVLCGLVRAIDDSIACHHVGTPEDLEEAAALLHDGTTK